MAATRIIGPALALLALPFSQTARAADQRPVPGRPKSVASAQTALPALPSLSVQPSRALIVAGPMAAVPAPLPSAALPSPSPAAASLPSLLIEQGGGGQQAADRAAAVIDGGRLFAGRGEVALPAAGAIAPSGLDSFNGAGLSVGGQPSAPQHPRSPRPTFNDRLHYARLVTGHLYFYLVTNIVNKWGPYYGQWLKQRDAGATPIVSRPRRFFSHLRVMGQTGEFRVLGFVTRLDPEVIVESRRAFDFFFDAPAIGAREKQAFEGFLDRALHYNAERRNRSNLYKMIRDNMLKASLLPPAEIAPFFDRLYVEAADASQYQGQEAAAILEQFNAVILDELRNEPEGIEGRVLGLTLFGSFASGAATPASDFDVGAVTQGGSAVRVQEFNRRMLERWGTRQKKNPIIIHEQPLTPSRALVRMVYDAPYLILSPDAGLVEELSMRPGEPPGFSPSRQLTWKGRIKRWLQYAAVFATSLFTSPK